MIREPAGESALEMAARRLERAVAALEQRLSNAAATGDGGGDLFGQAPTSGEDLGQLKAELDQSRQREKQLEEAGAEASAALGRAILEIRSALNGAGVAAPSETQAPQAQAEEA